MLYCGCNELFEDTMITSFLRRAWCLEYNGTPKGLQQFVAAALFCYHFYSFIPPKPALFSSLSEANSSGRAFRVPPQLPKNQPKQGDTSGNAHSNIHSLHSPNIPQSLKSAAKSDKICSKKHQFLRENERFFVWERLKGAAIWTGTHREMDEDKPEKCPPEAPKLPQKRGILRENAPKSPLFLLPSHPLSSWKL